METAEILEELEEAQKENDAARVWRCVKILAKVPMGPKMRNMYSSTKLVKEDWIKGLQRQGNKGGMSATVTDWNELLSKCRDECAYKGEELGEGLRDADSTSMPLNANNNNDDPTAEGGEELGEGLRDADSTSTPPQPAPILATESDSDGIDLGGPPSPTAAETAWDLHGILGGRETTDGNTSKKHDADARTAV